MSSAADFKQRNAGDAYRPDWETPPELFARLDAEFGFTLDAAASIHNAQCDHYYTREDDGLEQDWGAHTVWLNPPYDRSVALWVSKAYHASTNGATVVCLLPARTDAGWWHDYVMRGEIRFLRGRVRFVGAPYNAPFPSAVVVFRSPEARPNGIGGLLHNPYTPGNDNAPTTAAEALNPNPEG